MTTRILIAMLIGALLAAGTMAILVHYATVTRPAPHPPSTATNPG
jgi:hypothetical protein